MRLHYRTAARVLALLCLYNVILHTIAVYQAWDWFEARGLILWPTTIYDYLPHHIVWSAYWLAGFALAGYIYAETARARRTPAVRAGAALLVVACLYDLVLHAFDLHGYVTYRVVSRDAFWSLYWAIATAICISIIFLTGGKSRAAKHLEPDTYRHHGRDRGIAGMGDLHRG